MEKHIYKSSWIFLEEKIKSWLNKKDFWIENPLSGKLEIDSIYSHLTSMLNDKEFQLDIQDKEEYKKDFLYYILSKSINVNHDKEFYRRLKCIILHVVYSKKYDLEKSKILDWIEDPVTFIKVFNAGVKIGFKPFKRIRDMIGSNLDYESQLLYFTKYTYLTKQLPEKVLVSFTRRYKKYSPMRCIMSDEQALREIQLQLPN